MDALTFIAQTHAGARDRIKVTEYKVLWLLIWFFTSMYSSKTFILQEAVKFRGLLKTDPQLHIQSENGKYKGNATAS